MEVYGLQPTVRLLPPLASPNMIMLVLNEGDIYLSLSFMLSLETYLSSD